MKILHVNHASLLIEQESTESYFLTDPWCISPAFGGWTQYPSPQADSIRKLLNIPPDKLHVIISHGHDDHVDEFFVKKHLRDAHFYVPKFQTNGLSKRVEKLTGRYPTELSEDDCVVGDVHLNSFINEEFTKYDAVITIRVDGKGVIHANDNWHPYPDALIEKIKKNLADIPAADIFYLVQFGIADCFPTNYPCFAPGALNDLIADRFRSYLSATKGNLARFEIKLGRGFHYANQSKYLYPDCYQGPNLYDLAQDFLKGTDSPFIQCSPGLNLDTKEAESPARVSLFRYCLGQLEKFLSQKLKGDLPLRLITFSDRVYPHVVSYQAREDVWQRIFIGEITLESIIIGGMGLIHRPVDTNISPIHHQVSQLSYLIQGRISELGLNFFYSL